ncbi:related to ARL3 - ADP-ribosylation factor-like protein, member of the arf-sar family in the ras superfamily [Melanopsichium pennsylvanicum]|uniref:Related to ARL3 - ADP-ribosylation factor-like protein, member of the arf-sar family in the ras superfamily n=2 Tax=Melanopsichium pennsylvanicum TaxID=63383 RepID=A0AAJ5C6H3_9BASI|nr:related to ARL3-ADP-ribosylation factor-like protein, member of the arf-sar family in the ras superfamily [Melanopsichium pennsylvanicum 4]SNX85543.1 related to ARL3 - ADP-ribosylation factor-like protein, member of the arf-sar family in the ras superfamily [Melanopsichium pennsylvanicum]
MYHLITSLYTEWTRKPRYNVLIVGPSGVGKSCLLEKIKSLYLKRPALSPNKIAPTVGQNVFELTLPSMHLHFWDLGGSPSVRTLWSKYFDESDAIVWTVDARHWVNLSAGEDGDRKGKRKEGDVGSEAFQARELGWKLLSEALMHPSLESRPILVIANKADDCESLPFDLTCTIKAWFADKLAHIDDEPDQSNVESRAIQGNEKSGGNIFADDDDDAPYHRPTATTSLTMNDRDYEWDVLLSSAIEGTGVHDAVDWLSIRVQASRNGRTT